MNDTLKEQKKSFLEEKILNKGLDVDKLIKFIDEKKTKENFDIFNISMENLIIIVKEFCELNNIPFTLEKDENENITKDCKINVSSKDEEILFKYFFPESKDNQNLNNTEDLISDESEKNVNITPLGSKNDNKNTEAELITSNNDEEIKNTIKNKEISENEEEKNKEKILKNNNEEKKDDKKESKKEEKKIQIKRSSMVFKDNKNDDISSQINYGVTTPSIIQCQKSETNDFSLYPDMYIKISDPEKTDGGFFGQSYITYLITVNPQNYKVRRKYADFVWLRDILSNIYNFSVFPRITRKGKVTTDKYEGFFINKRMAGLERFINYVIKNELVKNSLILYDFLTIEKREIFSNKKKIYEKIKIPSPNEITQKKSISGEQNISITRGKEIYLQKISENCNSNDELFKKLNINFKMLKDEYDAVVKRFNEISKIFNELYENSKKNEDNISIMDTFNLFSVNFNKFSEISFKHKNFINDEIREYFKLIGNSYHYMKNLVEKVAIQNNDYYKYYKDLIKRKNELYKKNDPTKWELSTDDIKNMSSLKDDKNLALSKILAKDTKNIIELKKVYGFYLNSIIEEYDRIKSLHSNLHKDKIIYFCNEQTNMFNDFINILGKIIEEIKD